MCLSECDFFPGWEGQAITLKTQSHCHLQCSLVQRHMGYLAAWCRTQRGSMNLLTYSTYSMLQYSMRRTLSFKITCTHLDTSNTAFILFSKLSQGYITTTTLFLQQSDKKKIYMYKHFYSVIHSYMLAKTAYQECSQKTMST